MYTGRDGGTETRQGEVSLLFRDDMWNQAVPLSGSMMHSEKWLRDNH